MTVPRAERDLARKLEIERAALKRIRTAPSPMVGIPDLVRQRCIGCGGSSDHIGICRYPAYNSGFFAGLVLAQCKTCGLGWVPIPQLDLDSYYTNEYADEFRPERAYKGKFYDKANPIWAREVHRPRDRARRHAADVARFGPFRRVLDIGAGEGIFLSTIEADEKYAWELDAYSVRILQDELGVTLQRLEARTGFYDLIAASHVLEHFTYDTLPGVLDDVVRALRPGGLFYAEVPIGAHQLDNLVAGNLPERPSLEPHTLFFSSYALNRLLVAAGLELVESVVCPWTRAHVPAGDRHAVLPESRQRDKTMPLVMIARRPG
jgi:SAM-dependent methyltransferase